jgi:hypothetical protein
MLPIKSRVELLDMCKVAIVQILENTCAPKKLARAKRTILREVDTCIDLMEEEKDDQLQIKEILAEGALKKQATEADTDKKILLQNARFEVSQLMWRLFVSLMFVHQKLIETLTTEASGVGWEMSKVLNAHLQTIKNALKSFMGILEAEATEMVRETFVYGAQDFLDDCRDGESREGHPDPALCLQAVMDIGKEFGVTYDDVGTNPEEIERFLQGDKADGE